LFWVDVFEIYPKLPAKDRLAATSASRNVRNKNKQKPIEATDTRQNNKVEYARDIDKIMQ